MKSVPNLRSIDLNLLLVFDVLYRARNTTRAAEALHLTQPAVSNALRRLRDLFDDVLFVKTATGMEPTPKADGIAALVDEALAILRLAVQAGEPFEPKTAARTFRLYVSDIGQAVFLPALVARLRKIAPGIRLDTINVPLDAAQEMMKAGQMDLAMGMFSGLHSDFIQQKLFRETYVVLVRKGHPEIRSKISIEQFFSANHVIYTPTAGSHARFELELNALSLKTGHTRNVALQLAHSSGIDQIISGSDLIACVPSRIASAMIVRKNMRALPLPFGTIALDISQLWHERFHRDEGHQWLRSLCYEMFHDSRASAIK